MTDKDKMQPDEILTEETETPESISETEKKTGVEDKDDPIKAMDTQIKALNEEVRQTHDRLLRTSAEFENYKKRAGREMEDFRKFAAESIIKDLLPVVDNLERAIVSAREDESTNHHVVDGVDLTLKEILKVLKKYSVNPIDSFQKPFDPTYHQAVMQEETDEHPEGIVLKELQRGYLMHERLIRPAMVIVSKAKAAESENGAEVENNA